MSTKSIVIVHGDKGGVGKSLLSSLLVDFAIHQFGYVVVVEGDAKIDDVARRFDSVPAVTGYLSDLARADASEDAALALFEKLEASHAEHVIINTPASASSTIDCQADIIIPAARELGYTIAVAWVLGPGEESARLAAESELCAAADLKVAVINERFGAAEKFVWSRHPAREQWLASGGMEAVLPDLTERVAAAVREMPGRISDLVKPEAGLPVITRQVLKRWVNTAWAGPCAALFGGATND